MNTIETYSKKLLAQRLRGYGLNKHQRERICSDVVTRLASLLFHWGDDQFRRTLLTLGIEEATFWEPGDASLDVRSLVVLGVRNSLIENLNAAHGSQKQALPDADMPRLTSEAINYFRTIDFAHVTVTPSTDPFGALPRRFPNAWQCLAVLAHAAENEVEYTLAKANAEPLEITGTGPRAARGTIVVVANGIDSCVDPELAKILAGVQRGELRQFTAPSFSRITRNTAKLLAILDHILRYGATLVTANYVLSATYVARRSPLIRPAHTSREAEVSLANPAGLSDRHRQLLTTE